MKFKHTLMTEKSGAYTYMMTIESAKGDIDSGLFTAEAQVIISAPKGMLYDKMLVIIDPDSLATQIATDWGEYVQYFKQDKKEQFEAQLAKMADALITRNAELFA